MEHFTIPPRFSVQRVLISAEGAEPAVADAGYFDHIIDLRELTFSSSFMY